MTFAAMQVTTLDYMGSDNDVVNAARVSFSKHHKNYSAEDNAKLIGYLASHNHWSPFAHQFVKLRIKAPIFVARQLVKHQIGFAWNEVSRRYVDSKPEFYEPAVWRRKAENVKQGSSDQDADLTDFAKMWLADYANDATCLYKMLLDQGVCLEMARMVLPQSMMTEWIWTGSLFAWARMYKLRADSHSQRETQEIAKLVGEAIEPLFPVSWGVLTGASDDKSSN